MPETLEYPVSQAADRQRFAPSEYAPLPAIDPAVAPAPPSVADIKQAVAFRDENAAPPPLAELKNSRVAAIASGIAAERHDRRVASRRGVVKTERTAQCAADSAAEDVDIAVPPAVELLKNPMSPPCRPKTRRLDR